MSVLGSAWVVWTAYMSYQWRQPVCEQGISKGRIVVRVVDICWRVRNLPGDRRGCCCFWRHYLYLRT